jgi:hypothetical protein
MHHNYANNRKCLNENNVEAIILIARERQNFNLFVLITRVQALILLICWMSGQLYI